VPRLCHLLWSGYVGETPDAFNELSYWVRVVISEHTRVLNAKLKRFLLLIEELVTYLRLNQASVINYCRRYWRGLPISISRAESTVDSGRRAHEQAVADALVTAGRATATSRESCLN
jgi:hypothetical protein